MDRRLQTTWQSPAPQPKLPRLVLKGCQRCAGDLLRDEDSLGVWLVCLQCGREYAPGAARSDAA